MLDKTYDPKSIEARIHAAWEQAEAFKAGRPDLSEEARKDAEPYCIVIPPPNVTGSLHMGHALNNTIQDVLCRFERMRGKDVLWQPGTDHAGIATQMVVERQLMERQQPNRRDMGREKFLETVWAWKAESGGTIINQLKRLGASCDWSRERFTMGERGEPNEQMMQAVTKVFVELHAAGLIYKDKRLVNWDPHFQTAISDLEVEQREVKGSFKWTDGDVDKEGNPVALDHAKLGKLLDREPGGHMYYFRYPLEGMTFDKNDASTFVVVATTRPETMLGDTAVAVHPTDEKSKYRHLVGKRLTLPLVGRSIPVVGDDYADPEKGTGAVKITPAHDFNDFEVQRRHNDKIHVVEIFDAEGRLLTSDVLGGGAMHPVEGFGPPIDLDGGDYFPMPNGLDDGPDRFGARVKVVALLAKGGYLEKIEPHSHTVPHGDRSGVPIEPRLTDQWYVNAGEMAKEAVAAVKDGRTTFVPERFANDYNRWLDPETIQPWCISRQLWWGHQIPAWYGPDITSNGDFHYSLSPKNFVVCSSQEEAIQAATAKYGTSVVVANSHSEAFKLGMSTKARENKIAFIYRDPDVLDTWFSSALWPFSTLGWPEKTPELARYYPTQVLVTGFDIIFFWVARMMMDGLHFSADITGKPKQPPFKTVYIHGLVRDDRGAKMSKSKGNVVDPLDLIEEFGADALRFAMAAMAAPGADVKFAKSRIEGYRNFATKLWNAARFAEMNGCERIAGFDPKTCQQTVNQWISGETQRTTDEVTRAIEEFRLNDAASAVYRFIWNVTCDWYLELIKPVLAGSDETAKAETRACAAWVLDQAQALLHPFMPFITEELWDKTAEHGPKRESLLALAPWPTLSGLENSAADAEMGWVIKLVSEVRSVRSEMNVPAAAKAPLVLTGASAATRARAQRHAETINRLARLESITFADTPPKGSVQIVVDEATVALPVAGLIDIATEAARLKKAIGQAEGEVKKVEVKLANKSFVDKAPPEILAENHERLAEHSSNALRLKAALARIEAAA
jgi:valyl-tRNA synthetase